MRWPAWLGISERRWEKSPNEEVQPAKTAWDFLQLLIVPAILIVIALAFNAAQASRDRSREDRRIRQDRALADDARKDAILDAYLAKLSGLILDRNLTRAKQGSAVRQVARTATLTTLRRLDGSRKREVVLFLYEARLLHTRHQGLERLPPVINLEGADLRGVDLTAATIEADPDDPFGLDTEYVLLSGDFRGARFDRANLVHVDFGGHDMTGGPFKIDLDGATFNESGIDFTSLSFLDLRGVSFRRAALNGVDFTYSDLRGAVFNDALIAGERAFSGTPQGPFDLMTRFDATCLTNASFAGATFPEPVFRVVTTFLGAKGKGVDFSDAENLSSVRLSRGVTESRFEGANERPRWTAPPLPGDPFGCE